MTPLPGPDGGAQQGPTTGPGTCGTTVIVTPYRFRIGQVLGPDPADDFGHILTVLRAAAITGAAQSDHRIVGKCQVRVLHAGAADAPFAPDVSSWIQITAPLGHRTAGRS